MRLVCKLLNGFARPMVFSSFSISLANVNREDFNELLRDLKYDLDILSYIKYLTIPPGPPHQRPQDIKFQRRLLGMMRRMPKLKFVRFVPSPTGSGTGWGTEAIAGLGVRAVSKQPPMGFIPQLVVWEILTQN